MIAPLQQKLQGAEISPFAALRPRSQCANQAGLAHGLGTLNYIGKAVSRVEPVIEGVPVYAGDAGCRDARIAILQRL